MTFIVRCAAHINYRMRMRISRSARAPTPHLHRDQCIVVCILTEFLISQVKLAVYRVFIFSRALYFSDGDGAAKDSPPSTIATFKTRYITLSTIV